MKYKQIKISDYHYNLPVEKIAQKPLPERDLSKLLIYKNDEIIDEQYIKIHQHIPKESLLIYNDTKVVEARIKFQKPSGGFIEIFCLEPHDIYSDITSAMLTTQKVIWKCLVGGAKKWKENYLVKNIENNHHKLELTAKKLEQLNDYFLIEFSWNSDKICFSEILHAMGQIPLPPYMKRDATIEDTVRYQTIYAKNDGSVAAPTAGLHFTQTIYDNLKKKNIRTEYITLHVGAGTFMPVKSEIIENHIMHSEYFQVSISTIKNIIHHLNKNIIPVGTTSLRTIESLYWLGVKVILNPEIVMEDLIVQQWDPYQIHSNNISAKDALTQLILYLEKNNLIEIISKTKLLITEHYDLKIANAIITNFHQPQSTLLLLISAFVKNKWRDIYQHALQNNYRFLSYGDGCLFWKQIS
jgi:S-adenosylmethionine:tRNA ribosyltransferase-isomerase